MSIFPNLSHPERGKTINERIASKFRISLPLKMRVETVSQSGTHSMWRLHGLGGEEEEEGGVCVSVAAVETVS